MHFDDCKIQVAKHRGSQRGLIIATSQSGFVSHPTLGLRPNSARAPVGEIMVKIDMVTLHCTAKVCQTLSNPEDADTGSGYSFSISEGTPHVM